MLPGVDPPATVTGSWRACTGKFNAIHAAMPPSRGWTRVIPLRLSWSATRALVTSLGQEQ